MATSKEYKDFICLLTDIPEYDNILLKTVLKKVVDMTIGV